MVILVSALVLSGCSYALHPRRTLAGQPFPSERLAEVTAGASEQQVVAALGKPLEIIPEGSDRTLWLFYERAQDRGCRTTFLGFIPWGDTPIRSVEARVEIEQGLVKSVAVKRSK
jgi:outer membrane protein assembly factor BamE (lipoprotein component of BamABCDE complex)